VETKGKDRERYRREKTGRDTEGKTEGNTMYTPVLDEIIRME
jgi:hypothetical protein